jgi:hypothetical protein
MSADTFLKALQRDVAWEFFYGIVNFDGVIGTVNHYGDVDLFAGRYNDGWRKAELDHLENFPTTRIMATFEAMLDDWTNEGFDPFASPDETGTASGTSTASNTAPSPATGSPPSGWSGVPGDEGCAATTPATRSTGTFADVAQDEPEIHAEPGFEGRGGRVQPLRLPVALGRHLEPVGGGGLQGQPGLPDHRGVHPPDHPRQRPGRMVRPAQRQDHLGRRGPRHRHRPGQGRHEGR